MKISHSRLLGGLTVLGLAATAFLALVVSPAEVNQGDAVRLLYVHVPTAWVALYLACGTTAVCSLLWLWPRTRSRGWDLAAGASAEIATLFLALTLVTGSIWGKTTWGVWWTWDARLTTTALLFVVLCGYLALRRTPEHPDVRARRSAFAALAAAAIVPVVHQSVEWWRTLHQPASLLDRERLLDPEIHGSMLAALLVGLAAFSLLYAWLLVHRLRVARLDARLGDRSLEEALAERRAEAGLVQGHPRGTTPTKEAVVTT